jgi:hypothetical protein
MHARTDPASCMLMMASAMSGAMETCRILPSSLLSSSAGPSRPLGGGLGRGVSVCVEGRSVSEWVGAVCVKYWVGGVP